MKPAVRTQNVRRIENPFSVGLKKDKIFSTTVVHETFAGSFTKLGGNFAQALLQYSENKFVFDGPPLKKVKNCG